MSDPKDTARKVLYDVLMAQPDRSGGIGEVGLSVLEAALTAAKEEGKREARVALAKTIAYIEGAMRPESVAAACCETAWDRAHRDGLKHALNAINAEFAKSEPAQ